MYQVLAVGSEAGRLAAFQQSQSAWMLGNCETPHGIRAEPLDSNRAQDVVIELQ